MPLMSAEFEFYQKCRHPDYLRPYVVVILDNCIKTFTLYPFTALCWPLFWLWVAGVILHLETKEGLSCFLDQVSTVNTHLSDPRQLKQKLYQSQQRATLCSQAAEEAEESRGDAEKSRALAEARALACERDKEAAEADRCRLGEGLQQLKKEVHTRSLTLILSADLHTHLYRTC